MQIIKISSLGCTSCIIVNNVLEKILENYKVYVKELDYDFDDFSYEVGKTLPVLIFEDNNGNELSRLVGEVSYEDIENEIKKLPKVVINEKNNICIYFSFFTDTFFC